MNAKQTTFLAAHAAALPAYLKLEDVRAFLESGLPALKASAMATNATYTTICTATPEAFPIATLSRPRAIGGDGLFRLALGDGREVAAFASCPTLKRCLEAVYSYLRAGLPTDCDPAAELDSYRESFNDNWFRGQAGNCQYPTFRASALTLVARWARRIALAGEAMGSPTPRAEGPDCDCLECGQSFAMGSHGVQICPTCYPLPRRLTIQRLEEEARQAPAPRPMAERAGLGDAIRRGMAPDVTPAPFFGYPLAPTRAAPAPLWPVQPRRAFADLVRVMGGR